MAFENATRQNRRKIFNLPYDSDNRRISKDLPATGLVANLYIRVKGVLTVTPGTGTATLKANQSGRPFGLLDRIQLVANAGTQIVDVSGFGLYLRNLMTDNAYPDVLAANLPDYVTADAGNPTYQFGTSSGDNAVEFTLKVPIVNNDRDLVGLILLQNRETLVTLTLDWANVSSLFTLTGNAAVSFAGNSTITMEYYSVPLNTADYPNLSVVHQMLEDKTDIDGTGDYQYTVPRGNIYMRMIHRVLLNDSPASADDIERLTLKYNQSEEPFFVEGRDQLAMQRERYKRDLPKGVYAYDFTYQGQAGLGGSRDLVNSRAITDFISMIHIGSGATLGTNNNKLMTVREQLVPLG